jgi:diguanylate cyclase (GGDEF)-like protein
MRPLALLGLFLSLLLAGVAVFDTAETISARRNTQDRTLQAAVGLEMGRISSSEQQMRTAAQQMLVNPSVLALLEGRSLPGDLRRAHAADAAIALDAFERTAIVPLSSACIDDATGRQVACGHDAGSVVFPVALRATFAGLASGSDSGAATRMFLSPVSARPSVAFVVPLRVGVRLLGLVHFDISSATTRGSSLIVNDIPGIFLTLAGFEDGRVLMKGYTRPFTREPADPSASSHGRAIDRGPWSTITAGHRTMVAVLPLRIGGTRIRLAVIATASTPNPGLLNAWAPGMFAVLILALCALVGSVVALVAANRRVDRELSTDPLTKLRNRRALMEELPRVCQRASDEEPAFLWFFDLNGFKGYNDSFGHLAGDALLTRLGRRLQEAVSPIGTVYRLGGDEFCVLISAPLANPLTLFQWARDALSEQGGAFTVTASAGAVEIPRETSDPTYALRLADQHMYRDKAASRGGAAELVTAVLHAALAQRHPELVEHSSDVANDVELLARTIGLDEEAVAMVIRAGDLHDVGKLGIPDEIISKAGPLTEGEWEFMRQHTVMGERIIAAAGPSLARIAPLVRASHERWDGKGYPRRPRRRGDPARRAHHHDLRLLPRDARRAPLQAGDVPRVCPRGAAPLRWHAVRPPPRRGLLQARRRAHLGWAPAQHRRLIPRRPSRPLAPEEPAVCGCSGPVNIPLPERPGPYDGRSAGPSRDDGSRS